MEIAITIHTYKEIQNKKLSMVNFTLQQLYCFEINFVLLNFIAVIFYDLSACFFVKTTSSPALQNISILK